MAPCSLIGTSYHSGARGPLPSGRGVNGPLLLLCSNTRALLPVGARALTPCGVACGPVHCAHPVACARRSAGQAASGYNRRGPLQSHVGWPSIRTPARSGGHPASRSASCRSAEKPLALAMGSVTALVLSPLRVARGKHRPASPQSTVTTEEVLDNAKIGSCETISLHTNVTRSLGYDVLIPPCIGRHITMLRSKTRSQRNPSGFGAYDPRFASSISPAICSMSLSDKCTGTKPSPGR